MNRHPFLLISLLFFMLTGLIIWACTMGYIQIPLTEILFSIGSAMGFIEPNDSSIAQTQIIIMDVRLPRILAAMLVGGCLAVAGCVFQAVLLNPLADPYTLGVSSGAAFGASLSLVLTLFGLSVPSVYIVPIFAFAGSILTLFTVFTLAGTDTKFGSNTLILSGVIVSAILSAGIGFLKYLADEQVNVIIFWLMGSLMAKNWHEIKLLLAVSIPVFIFLYYHSRDMNILSFGDKTANSLGVDAVKTRTKLLVAASIVTAVCVSISGIIGFIGLIIPHLLRNIVGPDNRVLLPASFLAGGILLLSADTLTRAILPNEVPIGILTALIGGPFFCYIFAKNQRKRS